MCFVQSHQIRERDIIYGYVLECLNIFISVNFPKSRRTGANDLFREFLQQYKIDENLVPLLKLQLEKNFDYYNKHSKTDHTLFEGRLKTCRAQEKQLKIRYGLGDVDRETYQLTVQHLQEQIRKLN
jgi:hypothetical protein